MRRRLCRKLIAVCILSLCCQGCARRGSAANSPLLATPSRPQASPSGKYELRIVPGNDRGSPYFSVEIWSKQPQPQKLYTDTTKYYERFTNYFLWDSADRVWVYSGDWGTFVLSLNTQGAWEKAAYEEIAKTGVAPPPLLKQLRPKVFRTTTSPAK